MGAESKQEINPVLGLGGCSYSEVVQLLENKENSEHLDPAKRQLKG